MHPAVCDSYSLVRVVHVIVTVCYIHHLHVIVDDARIQQIGTPVLVDDLEGIVKSGSSKASDVTQGAE